MWYPIWFSSLSRLVITHMASLLIRSSYKEVIHILQEVYLGVGSLYSPKYREGFFENGG